MNTKTPFLLILALILAFPFSGNSVGDDGVVINGIRWATRNVGETPKTFAEKPESDGGYFQWNKGTTDLTENWIGNGASTWEKQNDPCPDGWRVPTMEELEALANAHNKWHTIHGVRGKFFGTGHHRIFLPAGGYRDSSGELYDYGVGGYYWSSTLNYGARNLYFYDSGTFTGTNTKSDAFPIRCVAK